MLSKSLKAVFIWAVLFLFLPEIVFASIIINEIAWAGMTDGWRYEWVELFNGSGQTVDVSEWQIENGASSNKALVLNSGTIPSNGYFLVCRKEMNGCDVIETKLSLHNEYDKNGRLVLRDSTGGMLDITPEPETKSWPGGDNETKQTMERVDPSAGSGQGWQTSQEPNGTPKTANSTIVEPSLSTTPSEPKQPEDNSPSPPLQWQSSADDEAPSGAEEEGGGLPWAEDTPDSTDMAVDTQPPPQPITYPSNIYINEILPSPKGADKEMEWLELRNANSYEVDISEWKIQDTIGAIKTYTLPEGTKISANGFLLLKRPDTKITLQNSGDGLELLNPNQEIVYSVNYPKAPQGQSYNRTNETWSWSTTLTPGQTNIITQPVTAKASNQEKPTTQMKQSGTITPDNAQQKTLANINQELSKISKHILTFIFAIIIAIGSGVIVLLLKKRTTTDEM